MNDHRRYDRVAVKEHLVFFPRFSLVLAETVTTALHVHLFTVDTAIFRDIIWMSPLLCITSTWRATLVTKCVLPPGIYVRLICRSSWTSIEYPETAQEGELLISLLLCQTRLINRVRRIFCTFTNEVCARSLQDHMAHVLSLCVFEYA